MSVEGEQVEGHAPLLGPAVLVSENCGPCRGTGFLVKHPGPSEQGSEPWLGRDPAAQEVPTRTVPCEDCESSGRQVREVPLGELMQLLQQAGTTPRAPSPSELRGGRA